jgi:hypothetical protein
MVTNNNIYEPSMTFDKNKPYDELPLLPPKKDVETKLILKKAIKAKVISSLIRISYLIL